MFISLKWVIFLKMRCSVSKNMSKMTHVNNKNTNNYFHIGAADSFKCKQIIRNCIFHSYFHETPSKTLDCKDEDSTDTTGQYNKQISFYKIERENTLQPRDVFKF